MKPIKLVMSAFGPYLNKTVILEEALKVFQRAVSEIDVICSPVDLGDVLLLFAVAYVFIV